METLSCQQQKHMSNSNKNIIFIEANVMNVAAKFQFHPHYCFWGDDFLYFFCKFSLLVAIATNQIQQFVQIHTLHRGLLKEHFCKNIYSEITINANFLFSYYKSMETMLPQQPEF